METMEVHLLHRCLVYSSHSLKLCLPREAQQRALQSNHLNHPDQQHQYRAISSLVRRGLAERGQEGPGKLQILHQLLHLMLPATTQELRKSQKPKGRRAGSGMPMEWLPKTKTSIWTIQRKMNKPVVLSMEHQLIWTLLRERRGVPKLNQDNLCSKT